MNSTTPHISVNKLGEYIFATQAKKRSILKTMKFPSTFKLARYPEPQSAFINYMADEKHDISIFEKKKNQVASKQNTSDWVKGNKECCLQALNHLIDCAGALLVPYMKYIADRGLPPEKQHASNYNVMIHIKPEVILLDAKTKEIKGAIKLIFSKTRKIELQEGAVIAAGLQQHLETLYKIKLKPENCLVLDVFHDRKFTAPKFLQPSKMQMKMACREILELWPTIND